MALSDKQYEALGMASAAARSNWHIDAGTVPISTLKALERRGLVELSWKYEGALYTSNKPYRAATITAKGQGILIRERHDRNTDS